MLLKVVTGFIFIVFGLSSPVLAQYGHVSTIARYLPEANKHLKPLFDKKGISFPPKRVAYVAIKDEKILELWAKDYGEYKYIKSFPILRASGLLGPKLQQGDKQVPEGIYALTSLNHESQYHLSIKIDYPNDLDKFYANYDKRSKLGGAIFIHGGLQSVGCLSMGNKVVEQLYVLTALTGPGNSKIVITPTDFRKKKIKRSWLMSWVDEWYYYAENDENLEPKITQYATRPVWINQLYGYIKDTLAQIRHPNDIRPLPDKPYKRYKIFDN